MAKANLTYYYDLGTGRLVLVGDERVSVQGLSSFATIRATACVYAGRWMYEVQLGTKGIMQVSCSGKYRCNFNFECSINLLYTTLTLT